MNLFYLRQKMGFTLIEIVVMIIIIGIIAAMGLPQFSKLLLKQQERDMVRQGVRVRFANEIYKAKKGHYWYPSTAHGTYGFETSSMQEIKNGLGVDLDDASGKYSFYYLIFSEQYGSTPPDTYGFTITWEDGTSREFSVLIDQNPLTQMAACMPEEQYDGPVIFKPIVLVWEMLDDFFVSKAYAPCYIVLNETEHDVPCCCTGKCPTLVGRCTGTGCGCT